MYYLIYSYIINVYKATATNGIEENLLTGHVCRYADVIIILAKDMMGEKKETGIYRRSEICVYKIIKAKRLIIVYRIITKKKKKIVD